jgi:hypothetical protein
MATVEPKLMLLTELSNPEEKTPYMVGKIGHAPEMHNTYYRTKNGFLIPCPILFFSDSYRRPATIIYSNDQNNKPNNPQFFDDLLLENRLVVDEILAVTDGGSEYKLTTPRAPGFYLYDSFSFFNPTILRDLLKLLSEKVHKNGELAPSFKELLDFETNLQQQYLDYYEALIGDKGVIDPSPRGLKELNLIWEEQ